MSLYNGPPRPGAQGGKDQFSWDNVKSDKDREFYLGHTVKALTGRWTKCKVLSTDLALVTCIAFVMLHSSWLLATHLADRDPTWYANQKQELSVTDEELKAVKQKEEEAMMQVNAGMHVDGGVKFIQQKLGLALLLVCACCRHLA